MQLHVISAVFVGYVARARRPVGMRVAATRAAPRQQPTGYDYCEPTTRFIRQPVDQFSYGAAAFDQKYLVCDKWYDRAKPPVLLLYMGGEGGIEGFFNDTTVLFSSIAPATNALVVFLEHRYYGSSQPTPKYDYLSMDQAMADAASFVVAFQSNASAPFKTFLFGGSYGGMLVGWFRLKYPHLSTGGVISSGPLNFNPYTGRQAQFWNATLHTFNKSSSSTCADAVTDALAAVQETEDVDALLDGFQVCPLTANHSLAYVRKALNMYLRGALSTLACVNYPYAWDLIAPLPARPVNAACERLLAKEGIAGLNDVRTLFLGADFGCRNIERELVSDGSQRNDLDMSPWNYQACTEIPMEPLTTDFQGFYPPDDESFTSGDYQRACTAAFPNARIPDVYGGGAQTRNVIPAKYGLTEMKLDEAVWQPLSRVVIVDHEYSTERHQPCFAMFQEDAASIPTQRTTPAFQRRYDPWRTGALDVRGGQRVLDFDTGAWTGANNSNEVYKIEPVPAAAHHQDLIAESSLDPPELLVARRAILSVLRGWAAG